MAEIKSALELALEKTENIKGDKESIALKQAEEDGRRLASSYLKSPGEHDLQKELKTFDGKKREKAKQAVIEVLLANLVLPTDENYAENIETISNGLQALASDKKSVAQMLGQVTEFFGQYIQNKEQVADQIKEQFEPRIKQREEELSKQMGSQVRIDPMQDPEYAKTVQQTMMQLEQQYQNALSQAKGELKNFCS